ncbi:MAG: PaaI family thioesterase [Desulfuromonadales bacterium]|nr:PaaI family thioesterase [Desulfuromonadales bacterium]
MKHQITGTQNISKNCLVCGVENPFGLKTRFYTTTENEVIALFSPLQEHQGYPNIIHGGISAAILDETIGRAIMCFDGENSFGLTIELNVRYKKPVPLDVELKVVARITKDNGRIFEGSGELYLPNGEVAIAAQGKYMKRRLDQITDKEFAANEWFVPEDELPGEIEV